MDRPAAIFSREGLQVLLDCLLRMDGNRRPTSTMSEETPTEVDDIDDPEVREIVESYYKAQNDPQKEMDAVREILSKSDGPMTTRQVNMALRKYGINWGKRGRDRMKALSKDLDLLVTKEGKHSYYSLRTE